MIYVGNIVFKRQRQQKLFFHFLNMNTEMSKFTGFGILEIFKERFTISIYTQTS